MVGREIDNIYPNRQRKIEDEVVLEIKDWNAYDPKLGRDILKNINLFVKKGNCRTGRIDGIWPHRVCFERFWQP